MAQDIPVSGLHGARPTIPPGFVRRPRVDDALDRGTRSTVTLVSAGPGYGKSLAVSSWAERARTGGPIVWMTADASGDLWSFWSHVLTALAEADAVPDHGAVRDLMPATEFGSVEIARIAEGLDHARRPITLVIDDLHVITAPEVMGSLAQIIDRRPAGLRLVLISRTEPALGLRRLHMAGGLTEIHADLLAFDHEETEAFCAGAGLALQPGDVRAVAARTEGWPAGLRLLLLGARDDDIRASLVRMRGDQRHVAGYLLEEVLDRLTASDREFLLATSIVDPVSGDLARALSGRPDSRGVLAGLVAANALTVRLSDRPDGFRYHPLLRELLLHRLAEQHPDRLGELNRTAARWHLDAGDPISAIRYLGAAGDWNGMLDVVASTALPLILSPQAPALVNALGPAADQSTIRPSVATLLLAALVAFHHRDIAAMELDVIGAQRLLDDGTDTGLGGDEVAGARLIIDLTRMVCARVFRPVAVVDRCDAVAQRISAALRPDLPAAAALLIVVENNRAIGLMQRGELDAAQAALEHCRRRADAAGMGLAAAASASYLAVIDVIGGRLSEVERRVGEILSLAERRGWSREPQIMACYAASALLHVERNELDQAGQRILFGRAMGAGHFDGGAWLMLEIAAVRAEMLRGDVFAVRAARVRLDAVARQVGELPDLLRRWMRVVDADVALMAGEIPELPDTDGPRGYAATIERVVRAKASLAAGRPVDAATALGEPADYAPYQVAAVDAAVVSAVAAHQLRQETRAVDRMAEAIARAAPERLIRSFLLGGKAVPMLLTRLRLLGVADHEFLDDVLTAVGGTRSAAESNADAGGDTLSERELVVLRYLPTMYKAAEIAADLFVSVNTVKSHQQSIYRKLGVSSRRAAVDSARERNLL